MTLALGTRIGPYEIVSLIGSGGTGEVYRGRDTRLKRDVAIKVLPRLVADDPERLARFEREAQVLASMNHPHIAQIHGLEETVAGRALIMEVVEGEDLSRRIERGPTDVAETIAILLQIADGLEAAHTRGSLEVRVRAWRADALTVDSARDVIPIWSPNGRPPRVHVQSER